jgi:hypothetical protein
VIESTQPSGAYRTLLRALTIIAEVVSVLTWPTWFALFFTRHPGKVVLIDSDDPGQRGQRDALIYATAALAVFVGLVQLFIVAIMASTGDISLLFIGLLLTIGGLFSFVWAVGILRLREWAWITGMLVSFPLIAMVGLGLLLLVLLSYRPTRRRFGIYVTPRSEITTRD